MNVTELTKFLRDLENFTIYDRYTFHRGYFNFKDGNSFCIEFIKSNSYSSEYDDYKFYDIEVEELLDLEKLRTRLIELDEENVRKAAERALKAEQLEKIEADRKSLELYKQLKAKFDNGCPETN